MYHQILKLFYFLFLIIFCSNSFAEINSKTWSEQCNKNKSACMIAIKNEIKLKDNNKEQTLATAYVQMGSTKERKMNLVDKEDQTYKLSEENKNIPLLFVNLPLNADLRKKPLIQIDEKDLGNLDFLHCNNSIGCKTSAVINDEVINLLKKGKNISIIMGVFGSNKNLKIDFPLKGFSKAYDNLI